MKARFKENGWTDLIYNKIYDVSQHDTFNDMYHVVNECGNQIGIYKYRFDVDLVELKRSEIKDARDKINTLISELEKLESTPPKVGDKYIHKLGDRYLICRVGAFGKFFMVCYDGDAIGTCYSGERMYDSPEGVFFGNEYAFTLIKE